MIQDLFNHPLSFLISAISIIVVITIHEFAHAWAAERLGDPTPRLEGRLTLNPLRHLDPIGTLLILFVGFGWGRPVQFDPFNLQNPRRDAAWISLAGPASNFILAIVIAILLHLFIFLKISFLTTIGLTLGVGLIKISLLLGIFNLIPVEPLDGFKIVGGLLSGDQAHEWNKLRRYGLVILIFLMFPIFGGESIVNMLIYPIFNAITGILLSS
jgi:Zn-dependent protease